MEARDAARHPTEHRTAHKTQSHPTQNVSGAVLVKLLSGNASHDVTAAFPRPQTAAMILVAVNFVNFELLLCARHWVRYLACTHYTHLKMPARQRCYLQVKEDERTRMAGLFVCR